MPPELIPRSDQRKLLYVKVVDAGYEPDEGAATHSRMCTAPYDGWMKASIMGIWRLWELLEHGAMFEMAPPAVESRATFSG